MARPKEYVIVCLDVSNSMRTGEPSRLSSAIHAVRDMINQKILFAPHDEVGLVCFGTEGIEKTGFKNLIVLKTLIL
jgi:hypothetical protein